MTRPLRIEYPGAFYHVYARGNRRQPIFSLDEDRHYFMKVLREAQARLGILIHVYCLMDNHYHLVVETPEANLSQSVHYINASYAIYFNKKREVCGHLFQGRFRAILIQADKYVRNLTIYIHGNPVRKKIVERPEQFLWSSCGAYYGLVKPPRWLRTAVIMGVFGGSSENLRAEHERHLHAANGAAIEKELRNAARIGILGEEDFLDMIRRSYLKEKMDNPDGDLIELKRLRPRPSLSEIERQISSELGRKNRLVRKCVILLARKEAHFKLKEVGEYFGISPAAVSVSYRKTVKETASNETLQKLLSATWLRLRDSGKNPGPEKS